eukprot:gb/GECH01014202.1/.p1 GENE.gb/GECH01014202.1/~~gb/GECH01014202.1/.p1  ORF type:complete len:325 (+),score=85.87 gb/GECH01014202.1/:1-975(+)
MKDQGNIRKSMSESRTQPYPSPSHLPFSSHKQNSSSSQQNRASSSENKPNDQLAFNRNLLLENILQIDAVDSMTFMLIRFLNAHLLHPHLEIEAKLGRILYRENSMRVDTNALSETILDTSNGDLFFQSSIENLDFVVINQQLNRRVEKGQCKYVHFQETDYFYKTSRGRVRYTEKIGNDGKKATFALMKQKLEHIDIFRGPRTVLDFRISASSEEHVDPTIVQGLEPTMERKKDRRSYLFNLWQLDMTTVTKREILPDKTYTESTQTFEVELECRDLQRVRHMKEKNQISVRYFAEGLLSNLRALISVVEDARHKEERRRHNL